MSYRQFVYVFSHQINTTFQLQCPIAADASVIRELIRRQQEGKTPTSRMELYYLPVASARNLVLSGKLDPDLDQLDPFTKMSDQFPPPDG